MAISSVIVLEIWGFNSRRKLHYTVTHVLDMLDFRKADSDRFLA